VPFTGSVKLRSLLLKTGPGDQTPQSVSLVSVLSCSSVIPTSPCRAPPAISRRPSAHPYFPIQFANADSLDFSDAADKAPTQEFTVAQGREVGEYALKYACRCQPVCNRFGQTLTFSLPDPRSSRTFRP
jgi:hypothetical protein